MKEKEEVGDNFNLQGKQINPRICFFGNFPPRECGIATFTRDLSLAMDKKFNPKLKSRVIALNDDVGIYNYNNKVIMQLNKDHIEEYINIAKRLNKADEIKLVCIQHEFGIFGGEYGNYLLPFLEAIEKPVVTTFHSVLSNPDKLRKNIVRFICEKSAAVIVMARKAIEILNEDYGIPKYKIHLIYHGIPSTRLEPSENYKAKLGLDGRTVLSTFGLLSKGKGIEYVIRALPKLVKKYPNLLYLIIGETHPVVRGREGENYRNKLIKEVNRLGLGEHVKFYNKYLTLQEITEYLLATDIYLCTNLDRNQVVSGTLSYAMGCGKPVVSTPIIYAEEILEANRGIVVKFKNPNSYTRAIDSLLSDEKFKEEIEKNAYSFSRCMTWPNVAIKHLNLFNKIVKLRREVTEKYPIIKLDHLNNLTDDKGVSQFSKHSVPDRDSGYSLDDNSRALIVSVLHSKLFGSKLAGELIEKYLKFIERAQKDNGRFTNILYKKDFEEGNESEDSIGRAIWSLGYTIGQYDKEEFTERARKLLRKSYSVIDTLGSPRAKAFSLLGLYYYHKKHPSEDNLGKIINLADSLVSLYEDQSSKEWQWFEPTLTYSNSKIPEALFLAYKITKNKKYLEIGERSLNFLSNLMIIDDTLFLIGQNGWYNRNGKRAFFDQQPVDASAMAQTFLNAYEVTGNKEYYDKAVLSFNWFLGKNYLKQMVYDETTGGCYDGLSNNSLNLNQGAESTICYLMARLFLEEIKKLKPL